jgi:Phage P2 GpU
MFECSRKRIHTFSDLTVQNTNRFAEHSVHLQTPILEFVGPGLTQVSFRMNFNKEWNSDPTASLLILRGYVQTGFVAPLLVGMRPITLGFNLFVCTGVGEEHKWFDGKGVLFGAGVDVQLKEYRVLLS